MIIRIESEDIKTPEDFFNKGYSDIFEELLKKVDKIIVYFNDYKLELTRHI